MSVLAPVPSLGLIRLRSLSSKDAPSHHILSGMAVNGTINCSTGHFSLATARGYLNSTLRLSNHDCAAGYVSPTGNLFLAVADAETAGKYGHLASLSAINTFLSAVEVGYDESTAFALANEAVCLTALDLLKQGKLTPEDCHKFSTTLTICRIQIVRYSQEKSCIDWWSVGDSRGKAIIRSAGQTNGYVCTLDQDMATLQWCRDKLLSWPATGYMPDAVRPFSRRINGETRLYSSLGMANYVHGKIILPFMLWHSHADLVVDSNAVVEVCLTSDGIHQAMDEAAITSNIVGNGNLMTKASELVKAAILRGASDDTTAAYLQLKGYSINMQDATVEFLLRGGYGFNAGNLTQWHRRLCEAKLLSSY